MQPSLKNPSCIALLLLILAIAVLSSQAVNAQGSTTVSVSPQTSTPTVGQTITVSISVSNVQNLYGLEVTLDYNNAVLQLTNQQPDLGTNAVSTGGVLYGSPVTTDINNLVSGGLYYNTSLSTSSEYNLFATSAGTAQPFSGSGTIVTLTFKVISTGQSPLTLVSTLTDHPATGETSNPIAHNDVSSSVSASSSTTSSSASPTVSPTASTSSTPSSSQSPTISPSASPSSSPKVPEFPWLTILPLLVLIPLILLVPKLRKQALRRTISTRNFN